MIRKISGTTAVITGARSGIGRETALEFARAGGNVVVAGRREERLRKLVRDIESAGHQALSASAKQTGIEAPRFVPKFPAKQMARIIVQTARFPQPEVVMALDAQALNFANRVAPGLMDLVFGWSVPFVEGMRRGAPAAAPKRGNLYQPSSKE